MQCNAMQFVWIQPEPGGSNLSPAELHGLEFNCICTNCFKHCPYMKYYAFARETCGTVPGTSPMPEEGRRMLQTCTHLGTVRMIEQGGAPQQRHYSSCPELRGGLQDVLCFLHQRSYRFHGCENSKTLRRIRCCVHCDRDTLPSNAKRKKEEVVQHVAYSAIIQLNAK